MSGKDGCTGPYVGVGLTSLALVISVCLNILLYTLRRKERQLIAVGEPLFEESYNRNRFEEEEEEDEHLNQDNPIYGNICADGGPVREVCYESMAKQRPRQHEKNQAEPADISYASLDLTVNQKRKKKRKHPQKQNQTHHVQTHTPPTESGGDCEATLPSRTSSLIVSRSSIYLNSHQVALEAEAFERERGRERERERERNSSRQREAEMSMHYEDYDYGHGHEASGLQDC